MESIESSVSKSWLGKKGLDWYRRVIYHHDYLFTSVMLMIVHGVLCLLPVIFAPHAICSTTEYLSSTKHEQFIRWLLLSVFAAVPLFLDILFDHFKSTAHVVERNQWLSRIILLLALVCPSAAIAWCNYYQLTPYTQCRVISSVIPAQTMILVSSILCTMYREHTYTADEESAKRRFSIEKRSIAFMVHMTLSRAVVFFYFLANFDNGFKTGVVVVNSLVIIHYFYILVRYMFVLVGDRVNGEFQTPHALSDFLYCVAAFVFLFCGQILLILLQAAGAMRTPPDVAAITLSVYRLVFLVGFTLFITVIPGRVSAFAARLEHMKLQTRLNLIRYVSHEMRSPLNTAFLGLEFVTGELQRMHQEHISARMLGAASAGADGGVWTAAPVRGTGASREPLSVDTRTSDRADGQPPPPASNVNRADSGVSNASTFAGANAAKSMVSDVLDIVKQINASCNIALYTLNDLLTFDKLDEKKLEVELQPVNAWHFALDTAKPFKINAKESQVEFTMSCGNFESRWYRHHMLRADEFKLSQVLRNLISNAVKFTPAKMQVHMHVEMLPNYPTSGILHDNGSTLGNLVRISVRDTGPGISAENLKKLFGQYVQFNPSKLQKGGGSGLGLWISKSIVEMHGGTVHATSEGEGKGCAFILELPLFEDHGLRGPFDAETATGVLESLEEGVLAAIPSFRGFALSTHAEGDEVASPREPCAGAGAGGTHPAPSPMPTPTSRGNGVMFWAQDTIQSGAQFLNQKVKFKVNLTSAQRTSAKRMLNGESEASSKNNYSVNQGIDSDSSVDYELMRQSSVASEKPLFEASTSGQSAKGLSRPHGARVVPVSSDPDIARNHTRTKESTPPTANANTGEGMIDLEAGGGAEAVSPTVHRTWKDGLCMLAVDDTVTSRKMMARLLRAAGHQVEEAGDGLECLQMLHCSAKGPPVVLSGPNPESKLGLSGQYDVVLIDENMPNMSGPEAASRLRQCGYKGLIIGVTGDCYQDQMDHFVAQGANAVLPKPLKVDVLRAKLEELWRS